jgi:hypothetical protein
VAEAVHAEDYRPVRKTAGQLIAEANRARVIKGYFVTWQSAEFRDGLYASSVFGTRTLAESYARTLKRATNVRVQAAS